MAKWYKVNRLVCFSRYSKHPEANAKNLLEIFEEVIICGKNIREFYYIPILSIKAIFINAFKKRPSPLFAYG